MAKVFKFGFFVILFIGVIFLFVTATNILQLIMAAILYLLLTYFAYETFLHKVVIVPVDKTLSMTQPSLAGVTGTAKSIEVDGTVLDNDKRAFLKVIGAAGLSFFIFSLLGQRLGALPLGKRIIDSSSSATDDPPTPVATPPEADPTAGYKIAEIDDSLISYYGFTNKEGGWMIMRVDTESDSFRYAKGTSDFTSNWSNRQSLKYDYFSNLL